MSKEDISFEWLDTKVWNESKIMQENFQGRENKKINLEEQNNKPQPISNDSVHSFFNIFDKKETVQNGGFFPFFSNCNVTFNINK